MPDQGSVWDSGPQYPHIWPEPSGPPHVSDPTPPSPSPVDIDALETPPPISPVPPEPSGGAPEPWWRRTRWGLALGVWVGLAVAVVVAAIVFAAVAAGDDDDTADGASSAAPTSIPAPPTQPPTAPPVSVTSPAGPATTAPQLSVPVSTVPVATAPIDTAPVTSGPVATAPPATSPPATEAPTVPPTAAPTTAPAAPGGPTVTIIGSVGPCRYGVQCLLAGFRIEGFPTRPNEFVCEFGDGSRYTFRFESEGVEQACATGNPDSSITIEVDGVRSETFRG